jgi:organic hydroperoxide reductase OsmC/OhrA
MARDEGGKLAMTRVTLRPRVRYGEGRQPTRAEEDALHHAAHEACFIASSVRTEVACEPVRTPD